jgi:glycosyltransferase involved in cell wall biosynthesis
MTPRPPLVSVNLVTYNHESYIREAVRSVLRQTVSDLELVIVDDGSTDGTARAVAEFDDPRIVSIRQENQGPGGATNRGLAACRGRYVALMTGDDVCHPDRLELQLQAHERAGGGVVFSNVDYMDEDGAPLESAHYPKDYFDIPPMSRGQVLERFFHRCNFINTVTLFGELRDLRAAGPLDPLLYQLQDFAWLVRLVKRHEFTFVRRATLSYRARRGDANLSTLNPHRSVRWASEFYFILRGFFDALEPELFREAFRRHLVRPASRSPVELACEQAFLYARHPNFPLARLIGVEKLRDLLSDPGAAEVLRAQFRFTPRDFVDMLLHVDVLKQLSHFRTLLYVDTGKGFNAAECCEAVGNHLSESFALTFDLSAFPAVRELRWDPVEQQLCEVRLEAVSWQDRQGAEHELDLGRVGANGRRGADGRFVFETLDPMFFFAITGEVRQLTVRGRWQVLGPEGSLVRSVALVAARDEALRARERELRGVTDELHEKSRCLDEAAGALRERVRESHEKGRRLEEMADELRRRDQESQQKSRRLDELGSELGERVRESREMTRRLEGLTDQLHRCGRESEEKTRRLEELAGTLAASEGESQEKSRRLEELTNELGERNRQLQAILGSRRWRLLTAIRSIVPFGLGRRAG